MIGNKHNRTLERRGTEEFGAVKLRVRCWLHRAEEVPPRRGSDGSRNRPMKTCCVRETCPQIPSGSRFCSLVLLSLSCWSSLGFCALFLCICSFTSTPFLTLLLQRTPTLQPGKVLKAGLDYLPFDQKMGSTEWLGHRKVDKEGQEWSQGNRKSSMSLEQCILPEHQTLSGLEFLLSEKNRFPSLNFYRQIEKEHWIKSENQGVEQATY